MCIYVYICVYISYISPLSPPNPGTPSLPECIATCGKASLSSALPHFPLPPVSLLYFAGRWLRSKERNVQEAPVTKNDLRKLHLEQPQLFNNKKQDEKQTW